MHINRRMLSVVVLSALAIAAPQAFGASHLWRFNEIFTNADGTIQFIELKECCGADNETFLADKWLGSDATGKLYVFPANLSPPTGNRHLLIATSGFAVLPGAPAPDFIMPGEFFSLTADTLRYYTYSAATMTYSPGDLPTDGVNSLSVDLSTAVNSPTNFAGDTGSVTAGGGPIPVTSQWGLIVMVLALLTITTLLLRAGRPHRLTRRTCACTTTR